MVSMVFQFIALLSSLVQSTATMPARTGEVARQLTEQDIAALELVLPAAGKPWLLNGDRVHGNAQWVDAFLPPTTSTPELRRGTVISVQRLNSRNVTERPTSADPWVVQRTESYAQVAIAGRNFEHIEGDQDINRPFRVIGRFDDTELVGLVGFLRSNPSTRGGERIRLWPVLSVFRKADDLVEVFLREAVWKGQVIVLRQTVQDWVIVSVGMWAA